MRQEPKACASVSGELRYAESSSLTNRIRRKYTFAGEAHSKRAVAKSASCSTDIGNSPVVVITLSLIPTCFASSRASQIQA